MARSRLARSGRCAAQRAGGSRAASRTGRPASPAAFSRCSSAYSSATASASSSAMPAAGRSGRPDRPAPVRNSGAGALRPDVQQVGLAAARLAPERQAMVRPLGRAAQPGAGIGIRWRRTEVGCREARPAGRSKGRVGRKCAPAQSEPVPPRRQAQGNRVKVDTGGLLSLRVPHRPAVADPPWINPAARSWPPWAGPSVATQCHDAAISIAVRNGHRDCFALLAMAGKSDATDILTRSPILASSRGHSRPALPGASMTISQTFSGLRQPIPCRE